MSSPEPDRPMLFGFIDRTTNAGSLRQSLEASAERMRGIQHRVANASTGNADGFALPDGTVARQATANEPVDVEQEMVALADESIRYAAAAKMLERTYASLRTAIRGQR